MPSKRSDIYKPKKIKFDSYDYMVKVPEIEVILKELKEEQKKETQGLITDLNEKKQDLEDLKSKIQVLSNEILNLVDEEDLDRYEKFEELKQIEKEEEKTKQQIAKDQHAIIVKHFENKSKRSKVILNAIQDKLTRTRILINLKYNNPTSDPIYFNKELKDEYDTLVKLREDFATSISVEEILSKQAEEFGLFRIVADFNQAVNNDLATMTNEIIPKMNGILVESKKVPIKDIVINQPDLSSVKRQQEVLRKGWLDVVNSFPKEDQENVRNRIMNLYSQESLHTAAELIIKGIEFVWINSENGINVTNYIQRWNVKPFFEMSADLLKEISLETSPKQKEFIDYYQGLLTFLLLVGQHEKLEELSNNPLFRTHNDNPSFPPDQTSSLFEKHGKQRRIPRDNLKAIRYGFKEFLKTEEGRIFLSDSVNYNAGEEAKKIVGFDLIKAAFVALLKDDEFMFVDPPKGSVEKMFPKNETEKEKQEEKGELAKALNIQTEPNVMQQLMRPGPPPPPPPGPPPSNDMLMQSSKKQKVRTPEEQKEYDRRMQIRQENEAKAKEKGIKPIVLKKSENEPGDILTELMKKATKAKGRNLHSIYGDAAHIITQLTPPKSWREFVNLYGKYHITSFTIYKEPIREVLNTISNLVTLGQFERSKQQFLNQPTDKLVHVFAVMTFLETSKRAIIEKNDLVHIDWLDDSDVNRLKALPSYKINISGVKQINLSTGRRGRLQDQIKKVTNPTLKEFINNSLNMVGAEQFYTYDAATQNCQWFLYWLLSYNTNDSGVAYMNPSVKAFLMQPGKEIVESLPGIIQTSMNVATDLVAAIHKLFGGNKVQHS